MPVGSLQFPEGGVSGCGTLREGDGHGSMPSQVVAVVEHPEEEVVVEPQEEVVVVES